MSAPATTKEGPSERVRYLDVLRGIALLGILPANLPSFGLPVTTAGDAHYASGGTAGVVAFHVTRFFFDYKFITIFSLLFGAGIMILRGRAEAAGRSFPRVILRRLGALWLFGVAHAVLFWFGDVLAYYALTGLVLCWASSWSPDALRRAGITLVLVPVLFMAALVPVLHLVQNDPAVRPFLDEIKAAGGDGFVAGSTTGSWEEFFRSLEHWGPAFETEVMGQGSFLRITVVRTATWVFGVFAWGFYFAWRIAGLFLLGMAWVKSGWFVRPAGHLDAFRRMIVVGLAAGIPLQIVSSALELADLPPAGAMLAELAQYTGSLGLAAAYAGIVAWIVVRHGTARWLVPFEAIGRTAFSNYILQTVLCTTLFLSYGFAMFGRLDRAQLWIVVAGVWSVQLLVSPWWVARFRYGPLEWVWRAATYWKRP